MYNHFMSQLTQTINNLQNHINVDAVFITGSQGSDHKAYSDIDMVIILQKHEHDLTSLYTWIGDKFADIFFFDHVDLNKIAESKDLAGNSLDGLLVSWLTNSSVKFDKSGKITKLKSDIVEQSKKLIVPKDEKELFWQKINYNFVANKRYFDSNDPIYHEALEMRLLYSVSEIVLGYFEFRDVLWRGEKNAIRYLKDNDLSFYNKFIEFTRSTDLGEKYKYYADMFGLAFFGNFKPWNVGDVFPQSKDRAKADRDRLVKYWNGLVGK